MMRDRTGAEGTGQDDEGTGQGAEGTEFAPTQVTNKGFAPQGPAEEELQTREQILPLPLFGLRTCSCPGLPAVTGDTLLLLQAKGSN